MSRQLIPHPVGSPHYVVEHARRRARRGKAPSAWLNANGYIIKNPAQALCWARLELDVQAARLFATRWSFQTYASGSFVILYDINGRPISLPLAM